MKSILRNYVLNLLVISVCTLLGLWIALKDHTTEIIAMLTRVSIVKVIVVFTVVLYLVAILYKLSPLFTVYVR